VLIEVETQRPLAVEGSVERLIFFQTFASSSIQPVRRKHVYLLSAETDIYPVFNFF
jgi:hypothetical protein